MCDIEQRRKYRRDYYRARRQDIVSELGGACVLCGATTNLQIDHVNAEAKSFNIGPRLDCARSTIESELDKCQLLCNHCHLEKSKKDISIKLSGPRNAFYDKHGSDFPSSKEVIDLDNWVPYESATEFAIKYGLHPISVERVCRCKRKSVHGHHVIYKNIIDPTYKPYLGREQLFSSIEHTEEHVFE